MWWYAVVFTIYLTDYLLPDGRGGWPWNVIFDAAPTLLLAGWLIYVIGTVVWGAMATGVRSLRSFVDRHLRDQES